MIAQIQQKMINYFAGDVRRINHALKVHSFAKLIAELEALGEEEKETLEISAFLHDIGIKISEEKYNSSAGHYQEQEGPDVAEKLLKEFELQNNKLKRVLFLIGNHHSYDKIDGLDFQILVEADFLVNIDEDKMDMKQIESIKERIFKTESGKELIESLYNN